MKLGRFLTLLGLPLALFLPGCNNATEPTTTDPGPVSGSATEFFTGTLSPGGVQYYGFPVAQSLNVKVTLTAVQLPGSPDPVVQPLTLLLGTSTDGATCVGSNTVTVAPSLTVHIDLNLPASTYCVTVKDPGSLSTDVEFTVRIKQTLGTPIEGFAGNDTFSTNMYPGDTATRTFTVGQTSDVIVRMNDVQPPASLAFGVGTTKDLSDCRFIQNMVTTKGQPGEIIIRADPGTYCVRVYDSGNLTERVTFFMNIAHR